MAERTYHFDGKLIFFAEDDALTRKTMTKVMISLGANVAAFEDAFDMVKALERASKNLREKPDIIITDKDFSKAVKRNVHFERPEEQLAGTAQDVINAVHKYASRTPIFVYSGQESPKKDLTVPRGEKVTGVVKPNFGALFEKVMDEIKEQGRGRG